MVILTIKEADELSDAFKELFLTSKIPSSKSKKLKTIYYSFTSKIIEVKSKVDKENADRFNKLIRKLQ